MSILTVTAKIRMRLNTVPVTYRVHCDQCAAVAVNGQLCHEVGCPVAWKDVKKSCGWCGTMFEREAEYQQCCSVDCSNAFYGTNFYEEPPH